MSGSDDSWDGYVVRVPERSALQYFAGCLGQDLLLELPSRPRRVSDVRVSECVEEQLGAFLVAHEGSTAEQLEEKWRELGAVALPTQLREILETIYAGLDG